MMPRRPHLFFALTCVLSLPFWAVGALLDSQLLPGLPVAALMVLAPTAAATFLVFRTRGGLAVWQFLRRAVDAARMPRWLWCFALGTMPVVMGLSYVWLVATGEEIPGSTMDPVAFGVLFLVFLVAAIAEELGWSGYAAGPLYDAHGLVIASGIIGAWTVLWHLIPLLQIGRSWDWIAWWALGSVARRVIILWLYVHGGRSVFATSLFHAMSNVSWMMFPVMGSHYDPVSTATVLVCISAALVVHDTRTAISTN